MTGYDIISQEILKYYNDLERYPDMNVIAYFEMKYDHEKRYSKVRVLVRIYNDWKTSRYAFDYDYDFWEGQQDIRNIRIVPLDEILDKYDEVMKI